MRYPAELSTGGNGFWAWVLDGYSLDRIDSHTGEVSRTVASPFGSATLGFLVDGGSVWFAGTRLVRIDLASGQEVNRYALTRDPSSDGLASVVRGAGSLWVTRPQAAELLRVNPASGRVQHRFTHLHDAYAVAYDNGAAWVVTYDSVERVDAATNAVTTVSLPPPIASIAAGGGFGWASNEAKGTVYKIDGSGRIVTTYTTARRCARYVVRRRNALGYQPGCRHRLGHRRRNRSAAHVPLPPSAAISRCASRSIARRRQSRA